MINRSEILTAAWKSYRLARPCIHALGDESGKRMFLRDFFAKCLRKAWAEAKVAAADAARNSVAQAFVAAQARMMVEKVAAMPTGERSLRISQLRDELTVLDYAPLGVRTANRRRDLNAQLAAFA